MKIQSKRREELKKMKKIEKMYITKKLANQIFENLLKEYSGMLSRMKIRDGNEELNKICLEEFKKDLEK